MAFCSPSPMARTPSSLNYKVLTKMPSINDHEVINHTKLLHGNFMQPQNIYNRSRSMVYNRFSKQDWENQNKANVDMADKERSLAERLRSEAWQTVKSIDMQTKNRQLNNTKRLGERVADITFWKDELNEEIKLNSEEMLAMKEFMRVVDQFLADTRTPLSIAEDCLMHRESRVGIDQVSDSVEKALSKEVDTIKRCQDKLRRVLEKAAAQQKMTRAAQNTCEYDSRNKHQAQGLDGRMQQLHNMSSHIGLFPNIENFDNTLSVPISWIKYTQENIARSQREREASTRLRGEMDQVMRSCSNEMSANKNLANNAFGARIQELNEARTKMQAHLQKTFVDIAEMERVIQILKKAICDKEAPMKVAQTRLEERTRRIDVELCNDPSMLGLQREVDEIRESVRVLKSKLKESEMALARLQKTRSTIENDIATKERSIEIDNRSCMGLRKTMALSSKFLSPIY